MTKTRRELVVRADGGSRGNPGPAGYGALVTTPDGTVLAERAGYLGITTNNVAEYTGLLTGLMAARGIAEDARVHVLMDSRLVVEQMSGRWQIKHEDMRRLAAQARAVFEPGRVTYEWVPRAENSAADALANEAMDTRVEAIVRDYPAGEGAVVSSAASPDADDNADAGPRPGAAPAGSTGAAADGRASQDAEVRRPPGAAIPLRHETPTTFVLVRHGETPMTEAGRYSGSSVPGPSLSARGRVQAAQAADLVHRIGRDAWPDLPRASAVIASPMVRAQETAAAIGRRLGLRVETDERFAEAHFGAWEGLTPGQIEERWPGDLRAWQTEGSLRAPGGESYADVGVRVAAGLAELARQHGGQTVVVIGHTVQVRVALGRLLGTSPGSWSRWRVPPASASVVRAWPDGCAEIVAVGVPPDL